MEPDIIKKFLKSDVNPIQMQFNTDHNIDHTLKMY